MQIKELLREFGIRSNKLTPETTIQSLHMINDEVDDLLIKFSERFKVDMTGYVDAKFFLEDVHPLYRLRDLFYRIFKPEKIKRTPLTLDHLIKVAEKGKWFDPDDK
ncbi:MAG TPA: DUF1493 family protein [Verrucomicrobiae bacterium]|nr:DUF1493 family protein [Verrucomicrobiae bacterium]